MMNPMKNILESYGVDYDENQLKNYLNLWILGHEEERSKVDIDMHWLEGNYFADTIFSLWIPLQSVLGVFNPNRIFYKEGKYGRDKNFFLKEILVEIDTLLPYEDELVKELYRFANLASTRANVMKLPNRSMQARGKNWHDQMPKFLYECFFPGEFSKFFKNDQELQEWLQSEKLMMFFKNSDLTRDNILPLISRLEVSECERLTSKEDLFEMLKNYNKLLLERSELFVR